MMLIDPITIAVEAFKGADRAYLAASAAHRERELDVAIAEREGDPEKIAAAKQAQQEGVTNDWHPAYKARAAAVVALCDALGIGMDRLRSAMP